MQDCFQVWGNLYVSLSQRNRVRRSHHLQYHHGLVSQECGKSDKFYSMQILHQKFFIYIYSELTMKYSSFPRSFPVGRTSLWVSVRGNVLLYLTVLYVQDQKNCPQGTSGSTDVRRCFSPTPHALTGWRKTFSEAARSCPRTGANLPSGPGEYSWKSFLIRKAINNHMGFGLKATPVSYTHLRAHET